MAFSNDDLDDREFPDEADIDDGDIDDDDVETDTRECPRCGADVYEDVEQCPPCGAWLTADTSPWSGRSWWWIALGAVGIGALIWALSIP
jgi:ribosomal protein S27AE